MSITEQDIEIFNEEIAAWGDENRRLTGFCDALVRSEQLVSGAILAFDGGNEDLFNTLMERAQALGDEWGMHSDLRQMIVDVARENCELGREVDEDEGLFG